MVPSPPRGELICSIIERLYDVRTRIGPGCEEDKVAVRDSAGPVAISPACPGCGAARSSADKVDAACASSMALRSGAPLIRDRPKRGVWDGPGSAAHRGPTIRHERWS